MRAIRTVNGDGDSALGDYIQPGSIFLIELSEPVPFPPASEAPQGGAFYIYTDSGDVEIRMTAEGDGFPIPAGFFPVAADGPEEYWLAASSGSPMVRVLQVKEAL